MNVIERGWGINNGTRYMPRLSSGLWGLLGLVILGLAFDWFYAGRLSTNQTGSVAAFGAMVAGAAILVGGLLGFIFGIPRSLQVDAASTSGAPTERRLYGANTNLEQISDWLTKILVGVGLTQLAQLPSLIRTLGDSLSPGLGGGDGSHAFGVVLVVYFAVVGFLFGYLSTRIVLPELFRMGDLAPLIQASVQLEVRSQGDADAKALTLTDSYLTGAALQPAEAELVEALKNASHVARVQIFQKARDLSMLGRRNSNKEFVSRTIPVFKALISVDSADDYHRNHAQLALALQEGPTPDWAQSAVELTKAIQIRDRRRLKGWRVYEVRRARARIHLNSDVESIRTDLHQASSDQRGRQEIQGNQEIIAWIQAQNLTVDTV